MNTYLPLNALRAFEAVYRSGGVRPAARELKIAHSSVSRHVSELETWLGTELFDRSPGRRGLGLTEAGERLGLATRTAFADIAGVAQAIRVDRAPDTVTLSTTPSFAARWLLPRLGEFSALHPRIRVSVSIDQHVIDLDANGPDIAIRMGHGPWPGMECRALMNDCLFPVVGRQAYEHAGRPADLRALAIGQPGLMLLHDLDPEASWDRWKHDHGPGELGGLDVDAGPRLASSDLILRAAILGQGIALAREVLARDDIASGALVRIGKNETVIPDAYWLVSRKSKLTNRAVGLFTSWIRHKAKTMAADSGFTE